MNIIFFFLYHLPAQEYSSDREVFGDLWASWKCSQCDNTTRSMVFGENKNWTRSAEDAGRQGIRDCDNYCFNTITNSYYSTLDYVGLLTIKNHLSQRHTSTPVYVYRLLAIARLTFSWVSVFQQRKEHSRLPYTYIMSQMFLSRYGKGRYDLTTQNVYIRIRQAYGWINECNSGWRWQYVTCYAWLLCPTILALRTVKRSLLSTE